MQGAAELLEPLYECLRKRVLCCDYIQIDETTIPVLDKDKPGAARKGYHWVVRSPELKSLFFHYDKGSRAQYVAVELLNVFVKPSAEPNLFGLCRGAEKERECEGLSGRRAERRLRSL